MAALMSSILPTVMREPKPPTLLGHRKASTPAPKPDRPMANDTTIERLKNCRRVMPIVSSSGGTHSTGGSATLTVAGVEASRRATPARGLGPLTGRSPSPSRTGPQSRCSVSLLSTPVPSPCRRRAVEKAARP